MSEESAEQEVQFFDMKGACTLDWYDVSGFRRFAELAGIAPHWFPLRLIVHDPEFRDITVVAVDARELGATDDAVIRKLSSMKEPIDAVAFRLYVGKRDLVSAIKGLNLQLDSKLKGDAKLVIKETREISTAG